MNNGDPVDGEFLVQFTEKYVDSIFRTPILISSYDNRVAIEDMVATLKYMHQEYGCTVAILDNLNFFLKVVSAQMEKAEMDNAMHEFVMLAKKIPMHITEKPPANE